MKKIIAKIVRRSRRLAGLPDEAVKSGEIKDDALYRWIRDIAAREDVATMLEIGSSTGDGSTRAFIEGMQSAKKMSRLFCTELLADRFEVLQRRYAGNSAVKCYRVSTVSAEEHATPAEVTAFFSVIRRGRRFNLQKVLGWLDDELKEMAAAAAADQGIDLIKKENGIDTFDMVLIDGSEFTGRAELNHVYGAKYILLDDINGFKNHFNCVRLAGDRQYKLIASDISLRNGYAVFERV